VLARVVPSEWIEAVLAPCREAPWWNYLFLTKFPNRLSEFSPFPDNFWMGTTVDCQARVKNAEKVFRKVEAGVKWLSCEPLSEPLHFDDLGAFQWLVIGGASFQKATTNESSSPAWYPPKRWIVDLEAAAWKAGLKVYEKTNLFRQDIGYERVREYPGIEVVVPQLPEALRYLPPEID
jgi:protein gp37